MTKPGKKSVFKRLFLFAITGLLLVLTLASVVPDLIRFSKSPDIVTIGGVKKDDLSTVFKFLDSNMQRWNQPIGLSEYSFKGIFVKDGNFSRNFIVVSKKDDIFDVIIIREHGPKSESKRFKLRIRFDEIEVTEALSVIR